MKTVKIRNIEIGSDVPKICVPVMGTTDEEILEQTKNAAKKQPDLLEWRADFYCHLRDTKRVIGLSKKMRDILQQIPLIFTVRTAGEGGNCQVSTEDYVNILKEAAQAPDIDLIDVELITDLQNKGKKVIASNHHFHETPVREEMENILAQMEESGAAIRKLAVMPVCPEDVLELLAATVHANRTGQAPVITMSMSGMGAISRVCGQVFGSAVTFAAVGQASAPGQLALEDLKLFLEKLKP